MTLNTCPFWEIIRNVFCNNVDSTSFVTFCIGLKITEKEKEVKQSAAGTIVQMCEIDKCIVYTLIACRLLSFKRKSQLRFVM